MPGSLMFPNLHPLFNYPASIYFFPLLYPFTGLYPLPIASSTPIEFTPTLTIFAEFKVHYIQWTVMIYLNSAKIVSVGANPAGMQPAIGKWGKEAIEEMEKRKEMDGRGITG